ncbi:MAG: glycosyltransferase family 4 protein [Candidatus Aenigmarchaeota archaeon]|nr:glycosyltransferase family 4 protein [Candidatus Aenigmarchaeota archaeon]
MSNQKKAISVLFFPAQDSFKASTRTQVYERAMALRKEGIKARILIEKERRNPLIGNKDRLLLFPFVFWRYDIIFFQKTFSFIHRFYAKLAKAFGKKIVFHIDDYTPAQEDFRKMVELSHLTLVPSRLLCEMAKKHSRHVKILPAVVDTGRFPPVARAAKKPVVLGWVGRWQKNLMMILDTLQSLCKRHHLLLKIVGSEDAEVADECRKRGIPVKITGWLDSSDVPKEMEEMDIALLPSPGSFLEKAGMHTKLLEYMASGLPVVCTPIGEIPSIVGDGIHGYLPTSPSQWEESLERLITDQSLRRKMGSAGRRHVQKYSMRHTTRQMIGYFSEILKGS